MDIIRIPIAWLLNICYKFSGWIIGNPNYAIALLFFAILMKIILFPLGIKQQKNTVRQASLRPKEQAIRNKYASSNQQKMNEEIMKLYQDEHYSPYGGCLPMILQLVIIFALYNVVYNPLRYISKVPADNITNINTKIYTLYNDEEYKAAIDALDLSKNTITIVSSSADKAASGEQVKTAIQGIETVNIIRGLGIDLFKGEGMLPDDFSEDDLTKFTVFGDSFDLSKTPSISKISVLWVMPVLVFVTTFFSMKLTKKFTYQPPQAASQNNQDVQASLKIMDYAMPLMSTVFTFTFPAVIAVYWIYQNILSALQQFILVKMYPYPVFTEEDYKEANKALNKGSKLDKKAYKASGKTAAHRIDLLEEETPASAQETPEEDTNKKPIQPVKQAEGIIAPAALKDESDRTK